MKVVTVLLEYLDLCCFNSYRNLYTYMLMNLAFLLSIYIFTNVFHCICIYSIVNIPSK